MLELNSFAFQQPLSPLFQIWILRLAQHRLVSTLQSNPTREKERDGTFFLFLFLLSRGGHPSKQ